MPRRPFITSLAAAVVIAGCGGSGGSTPNKAGSGPPSRPQTIEIQSTDPISPETTYFAKQIEAHSGGTLTVHVLGDYPSRAPANEARLARDLRAGKADFGILPARAWAPAGVEAFDALQAPFVLGSYDVAREAIAGPAGSTLHRALERAGVTPLGLVSAELRRVLAIRPLSTLDAFRGLSIRIADNDTSAAVLRTLGAKPVEGITAPDIRAQLRTRRLAGAETAPFFALENGYGTAVKHITGYALFDRVDTLVASPAAWKRLSRGQQAAVTAAARDTIANASTLAERDGRELAQLCRQGVRVATPTEGQLDALADATEPVRAALRAGAATGPVLKALEATPGAGPQALYVPAECTEPLPEKIVAQSGPARIPKGTYRVHFTAADFHRLGQFGNEWDHAMISTTEFRDGHWRHWEKPDYGVPVVGGTYRVMGDLVRFTWVPANEIPPFTMRWSYYKGQLTWEPVDVSDAGLKVLFAGRPWKKVR
jgi:TRAP-type C4-dicarboxylate transport system substrate-binding protein